MTVGEEEIHPSRVAAARGPSSLLKSGVIGAAVLVWFQSMIIQSLPEFTDQPIRPLDGRGAQGGGERVEPAAGRSECIELVRCQQGPLGPEDIPSRVPDALQRP